MPSIIEKGAKEVRTRVEKYPMQKVPLLMREENQESNEDYEPKVVSFGPYHHGKEKLKFVEDFKPKAVKMFIRDKNEDEFLAAIQKEIEYFKSCYLVEFTIKYTNDEFVLMMLRDACVILNYIGLTEIEKSNNQAETINFHLGFSVHASIERDMYLLENQVPFRILEILVDLRYGTPREAFIKDMEEYFFKKFFNDKNGKIEEAADKNNKLGQNALHLLEIFRRVIVTGQDHDPIKKNDDSCYNNNKLIECLKDNCCRCCKNDGNENTHGLYAFRSVTDLKSKGINLTASRIQSLKGIRFSPTKYFWSTELKLPLLYVNMYTRVFFKNMIAYEFSPHVYKSVYEKSVTAYVSFMKLLVATKKDVKELREKKIIINNIGSDDEVVQLYKSLNTYEAEDTSSFYNVKEAVEYHFNSTIKMWIADFKTKYFNNPWTIIALVGSLFLLCLDIVQTYYTIHPPNDGSEKGDTKQSFSPGGF